MKTIAPQFDLSGMAGAFNLAGETITQAEPKPAAPLPDTGTASLFPTWDDVERGRDLHTGPQAEIK